jgi:hypothetical protein
MAKVRLPLLSETASGKFGDSIVFDKRGIVRRFVSPVQPNTTAQITARAKMGDVAQAIGCVNNALLVAELRTALDYHWFSAILGDVVKDWQTTAAEYLALTVEDKVNYDGASRLKYKLDGGSCTSGQMLYSIAKAMSNYAALMPAPTGANFEDVALQMFLD